MIFLLWCSLEYDSLWFAQCFFIPGKMGCLWWWLFSALDTKFSVRLFFCLAHCWSLLLRFISLSLAFIICSFIDLTQFEVLGRRGPLGIHQNDGHSRKCFLSGFHWRRSYRQRWLRSVFSALNRKIYTIGWKFIDLSFAYFDSSLSEIPLSSELRKISCECINKVLFCDIVLLEKKNFVSFWNLDGKRIFLNLTYFS